VIRSLAVEGAWGRSACGVRGVRSLASNFLRRPSDLIQVFSKPLILTETKLRVRFSRCTVYKALSGGRFLRWS
jgi:hypothetical protein